MRSPAPTPATRVARTVTANRASNPGATSATHTPARPTAHCGTPDADTGTHTIDNRLAHRARTIGLASQPADTTTHPAHSTAARSIAAHKPLRTAPQRRPL